MAALFHLFRDMHSRMGIDTQKLGCIMMDVETVDLGESIPDEWLYYSPSLPFCQGKPEASHVTLMYGLIQPGPAVRTEVDEVLAGWTPSDMHGEMVDMFASANGEPYACIVLKVAATRNLVDAHARLSLLPHIDTFWEYKPHVTLAYVKAEHAADALAGIRRHLGARDIFTYVPLVPLGLNYGG